MAMFLVLSVQKDLTEDVSTDVYLKSTDFYFKTTLKSYTCLFETLCRFGR